MSDHLEFGLYDRSQETLITCDDLPHRFQPNVAVFITFRTIDSLPNSAVLRMEAELRDWLNRIGQCRCGIGRKIHRHQNMCDHEMCAFQPNELPSVR